MVAFEKALTKFALALAQPSATGHRRACTDVTLENYLGALRRLDRDVGGLLDDPLTVQGRLSAWRDTQHTRFRAGQVSASKIACDVSALRAFYRELEQLKLYPSNPAAGVPSMSRDRTLPTPMPRGDVARLFAGPDLSTPVGRRDRAMLELYLHSLRNTEVGRLTIDRVQLNVEGGTPTLAVKPFGKGRKERHVPLNVGSARLVGRYLLDRFAATEWSAWAVDAPADPNDLVFSYVSWLLEHVLANATDPVFVTEAGAPLSKRWSNRHFRALCAQAGITAAWTPHSLRHRFGASMVEAGVDIRITQELMGHSDIRTTQQYTHVSSSVRLAATQLLDTPATMEVVPCLK